MAPWQDEAWLRFERRGDRTVHQGGATAPLKLQRAFQQSGGHCELPLLHTAGGLVGGDQLELQLDAGPGSRALITTVAAQKAYGSVARSRLHPNGQWARQRVAMELAAGSTLEWMPQELVLYDGALLEQQLSVRLAADAAVLTADVVRFGRTAAGEGLGQGCWRSSVEICRQLPGGSRWELVDRLELGGEALSSPHGLGGDAVFGSLVWAAPQPVDAGAMAELLVGCRADRAGLTGTMACGALSQGLIARYSGSSTQAARFWFCRIWARLRAQGGLAAPELPRVWPFQEKPWGGTMVQPERSKASAAATVMACT